MVAIGFGDLQGPQGLQVPREQKAIKVTLALQVQQGRSAQQAQKVPRDPLDLLDLLDLGGPRDLLVLLEIQQRHPGASNFVGAGCNRCLMYASSLSQVVAGSAARNILSMLLPRFLISCSTAAR